MEKSTVKNSLKPRNAWDWIAFGLCVSAFFIWGALLTQKYYFLGYYDWDLALYAQAMWSLCRGEFYSSLFDINFLANHAEYISFFIAPIYAIFKHPLTLVFLKVLSYSLGAYVFFHISRSVLSPRLSLAFMLLYLIFPANIYAMLYEFHIESVNIAFLFLLFYFFERKSLAPFYITAFFTALIKENMSPILVAFGLYAIFSTKDKFRWGIIPIIFGSLVFYVSMFIITPALRQMASFGPGVLPENGYLYLYSYLGSTPLEIVKNVFFHPEKIFSVLFEPSRLKYLNEFLKPLAYTPLFSPHILFLVSPVILQHLLSPVGQYQTIFFHYAATLTPFFFLAALVTLGNIKNRFRTAAFYLVFISVLLGSLVNLHSHVDTIHGKISMFESPTPRTAVAWDMINQIPPDAGVIATLNYLSPLSQRQFLYSDLFIAMGYRAFSGKAAVVEPEVGYALLNLADPWIADKIKYEKDAASVLRMKNFLSSGWKIEDIYEDIVLLKRSPADDFRLIERSLEPFPISPSSPPVFIDRKFRLLAFEPGNAPPIGKREVLPLVFHWKAETPIPGTYGLQLDFVKKGKRIVTKKKFIGYTFFPTFVWQPKEYVKETYYLSIAHLPPGQYDVQAYFVEVTGSSFRKIECAAIEPSGLCSQGAVTIGQINIPWASTQ